MIAEAFFYGLIAVLLFILVNSYKRFKRWEAVYNLLPGPPNPHWLLGHLKEFPGEGQAGIDYHVDLATKYPFMLRYWVGRFICFVFFHHPETVRLILKSSAPKPMSTGTIYQYGLKWLGEGLLLANGNRWGRNRRLLTPAFHFDILVPYAALHNKCTDILLEKLQHVCDKGQNFEAFDPVGLCSLDIICRCAFSYETDGQTQGEKDPYVKAVHRLSELWVKRSMGLHQMFDFVYFNLTLDGWDFKRQCDYVHKVADDVIHKRRKTLSTEQNQDDQEDTEGKQYLDFLDILLKARDENGTGLSDLDIRNEVDTFMFEGHDTTTSGVANTLLCLAKDQQIQDRVRSEVNGLLTGRDSDYINWSDLPKLEYLTMCIKEGLRMYCPVHVIQRETTEDLTVKGYTIPKGTGVILNIHSLHHNPTVWGEDANVYRPERFSPENTKHMDPFAFIPFSAGQRNCIGQNFAMMEMKIMIARIIRRFRLETVPGHVYKKKMGVVMRSENGILLKPTPCRF